MFYAVDVGGTNFRVVRIVLGGGAKVDSTEVTYEVSRSLCRRTESLANESALTLTLSASPSQSEEVRIPADLMTGSSQALFAFFADTIVRLSCCLLGVSQARPWTLMPSLAPLAGRLCAIQGSRGAPGRAPVPPGLHLLFPLPAVLCQPRDTCLLDEGEWDGTPRGCPRRDCLQLNSCCVCGAQPRAAICLRLSVTSCTALTPGLLKQGFACTDGPGLDVVDLLANELQARRALLAA